MFRTLLILLTAFTLAACGPAQLDTQQPLPTASADWTSITFTQSGGIMGMMRTFIVARDGSFTATDERANNNVNGKLSGEELAKLNNLIVSLSVNKSGQSGVCADCFIYSIEIATTGKSISAQADDVNLNDSGIGPLVIFLENRMSKALND